MATPKPLNDQIRHKFNQIDPFLKFIVQGSQKKYVRVAISQKFDEVFFQFPARIIAKIVVENATVVAFLEDFVCIFTLIILSVKKVHSNHISITKSSQFQAKIVITF